MIAIMIPIKPYWYAKILNGEKSIEVRKNKALAKATQKLIDKQGYAPILGYCSKDDKHTLMRNSAKKYIIQEGEYAKYFRENWKPQSDILNGKVPALLICKEVEEIYWLENKDFGTIERVYTETLTTEELEKKSCLTRFDIFEYATPTTKAHIRVHHTHSLGNAIHISQLEIFDKPIELSEFRKPTKYCNKDCSSCDFAWFNNKTKERVFECSITKAPQNYCYVEVEK